MQNNMLKTEKSVPELTSLDSTTTEQMQNSDLGTDRILMRNFKSDINI